MTHDPREALQPGPFCGGDDIIISDNVEVIGQSSDKVYARCNGCGANGPGAYKDQTAITKWNTRALTASPGEQKPPPAAVREQLAEALAENKALRAANTQLVLAERDRIEATLSTPPAAVESNGNAEAEFPTWDAEDEAYELGKRYGYESAVQDFDLATGGDGEFKGSTNGETVDVQVMKQRIIDRFAANASAEARLREALTDIAAISACVSVVENPTSHVKMLSNINAVSVKALKALSAGGDEAKKSAPASESSLPSGESDPAVTLGCAGAGTPLDPPDRREIVARALMEKWPGDYAWGDETREPNELAFEAADAILAALDGGAGA